MSTDDPLVLLRLWRELSRRRNALIHEAQGQGYSAAKIALAAGLHRKHVQRILRSEGAPRTAKRGPTVAS